MNPATAELIEKILLAFLSAIAGILAKTASDAYAMRQLRPDLLDQIRQTAGQCKLAFAPGEAKAAASVCDAARADLCTLIRLGARPRRRWMTGVRLLREASVKIGLATSTEGVSARRALEELRAKGAEIEAWLATGKD